MSDDSQNPKLPEPPDKPTKETRFSTDRLSGEDERDLLVPKEMGPVSPTENTGDLSDSGIKAAEDELGTGAETGSEINQSQNDEEIGPGRLGTGSLILRLTGTLRRVTGPLRPTDALPPKAPQSAPLPEKRRDIPPAQQIATASLPELEEPTPGMQTGEGTSQPPEGELGLARLGTGSLVQRLTGTLRRVTGPLRSTDALPPKEPQHVPTPEKRRDSPPAQRIKTASLPELQEPAPGSQAEPEINRPQDEDELGPARLGTGSLIQRLTGTLRRVTGPLRPTGGMPPQGSGLESGTVDQPRQDTAPTPETPWSRKNETVLSGQLGNETDSEPLFPQEQPIPIPESRRQVPDSGIVTGRLPGLDDDLRIGTESEPVILSEGDQPITPVEREAVPPFNEVTEARKPEAPLPKRKQPEGPDYISEMRQTLTSEEPDRPKRRTGSLIQRFTGTLRRITSPLRATDSLPREETKPPAETVQPDMADDFLNDRLGGVQVDEPAVSEASIVEESATIQMPERWGDLPDSGIEAAELLEMEKDQLAGLGIEPETRLVDDEPITLLESGAIAALGQAEEASQQEEESDWWAEIRKEAALSAAQAEEPTVAPVTDEQSASFEPEPDQAVEDQSPQRGAGGNLRNFITGILGRPGEKRRQQPEETEFPDELVTGRLNRSQGIQAEQAPDLRAEELYAGEETFLTEGTLPTAETEQLPGFDNGEASEQPYPTGQSDIVFGLDEEEISQEEIPLLEGLEVSFSAIHEPTEQAAPGEESATYELYPEDENLLWGDFANQGADAGEQPPAETDIPVAPVDIWGSSQTGAYGYGADLRQEIWGEELKPEVPEEPIPSEESGDYVASDEYTAEYLTGEETPPAGEEDTLNQPAGEEMSVQDLRSIALEDYEEGEFDYSAYKTTIDWGDEEETATAEPAAAEQQPETAEVEPKGKAEVEPEVEEEASPTPDWRTWLAARNTSQKLLLVEGALVVLAMLVAVPFFIFMIIRGPAKPAAQLVPNGLPAGVPIPIGLTLPGGWYFPLEKSTIANGKWQPVTSEWLEGTEVRRVVALPWNPQTEAVIKTFQAGNPVELILSDNSALKFKFTSIERVPVGNNQIYFDTRPSLVIILYNEKDTSRWVVICNP